ncbi:dihydropteroate synthase [Thiorhodococcus mannitoliphagus]|uniref:Dihydropteroate synthase n=2 Tax=Thiorhodococcus mannitoliphagus TaxID=329406 RepID=A0A6P1DY88_9GAMM|nr:dihydropteroate synthase [Thiorhodococcus mannitoliphagus]
MSQASQRTSDGPQIMAILNLTPDSFSDGGQYRDPEQAVRHALTMLAEGADILDLGGESTRPGSKSVTPQEQERRVLPVIRRLREQIPESVPMSIDTTSARVARAALDAGATWINDTSAGLDDPQMLALAAERGVPIVLMHRQGIPETMQQAPSYKDVVAEVCHHLAARAQAALAAGVEADRILLDPGIGFGKLAAHNLALLAALDRIVALGFQVLLGTSRKGFMRAICGGVEPTQLMPATCATTTLGVMSGVRVFRVHDVAGNRQAADIAWAVRNAG